MKICEAKIIEAKKLFDLEKEIFSNQKEALSLSSFYYHIKKNRVFLIKIDNEIVAYALWLERKKYFRLYSLAVLTKYQGNSFGKKLLKFSFENLEKKAMKLEVRVSNEKAINLYKKFGFKKIKILKDFYENEDGFLMEIER